MKKSTVLYVYGIIAMLELFSHTLPTSGLHHFTKPLLMLTLIVYIVLHRKELSRKALTLVVAGLSFSWLGDVSLMYQDKKEIYFMVGLGAFLVAHIAYIFLLKEARDSSESKFLNPQKIKYIGFFWLVFGGLISILYPHLGALKIPVIVYAMAITVMGISALMRYGRTQAKSYMFGLLGAVLFITSDSILAINKFIEPVNNAGILIMGTYALAQMCICIGVVLHFNKK